MRNTSIRPKHPGACVAFLFLITMLVAQTVFANAVFAQNQSLIGSWGFKWKGARDNYTGTLRVTRKVKDNFFEGTLDVTRSNGETFRQNTAITVTGNEVRIECSNPSVKPYNPDRFYVVRNGNRMEGYSLDTGGQRGREIVFTKL